MIDDLDRSIEKLLQQQLGKTHQFDLSFAIPDKNFTTVSKTQSTLSCYLYEINEDRDLRTVAPILTRNTNGTANRELPPVRVRLSYLITAWSPAQPAPGIEPEFDEHNLLSLVLQVLLSYPTLPPDVLSDTLKDPLPVTRVILPDTSKATSDFWTAIGGQLRPSLDYKVTIALPSLGTDTVPIATTLGLSLENERSFTTVGGTVRDARTPSNALAGAWVRINETGYTTVTDATGNFLLERLDTGTYTLSVRAVGYKEGSGVVTIPPGLGDSPLHDVMLTPL
jgi:hypothetical protein